MLESATRGIVGSMRGTDVAWAAGYFDGEGSVSIPLQRGRWPYMQVSVSGLDRRPIMRLMALFGGAVSKDRRSGGCYRWQINSREAVVFLQTVRPWLRCKDRAADVGIRFGSLMTPPGTRSLPPRLMAKRMRLRELIRKINRSD